MFAFALMLCGIARLGSVIACRRGCWRKLPRPLNAHKLRLHAISLH